MNIPNEILRDLQNHDLCGRMNEDRTAVAWTWDELYGPGGDDVWRLEVALTFGYEMLKMAQNPEYKNGLLMAIEFWNAGEDKQVDMSPWWYWWSAEEAHLLWQDFDSPVVPIFARAISEAKQMRDLLADLPRQDGIVLHIKREAECRTPLFYAA